MTINYQSYIKNEFSVPQSVKLDVLHMCMSYITATIRCSSCVTAVIFDLAMTSFVAGCQRSTSVIVRVQGLTNLIQVRNAANIFLQTDL